MWLEHLKELKKSKGLTSKQIADITGIPESTIKRIFSGDTEDPYMFTIFPIVRALGGSLDNILADTNVVLASQNMVEVKETARILEAERDFLAVEIAVLKDKVIVLTDENTALKSKIDVLKDEIIETHRYYMHKSNN